jgi:phage baseplate assembly protein W
VQTLAIVDGDLVVGAGQLLTLSGPNKVKQDLFYAFHEAYGSDPYHPTWGNVLGRFLGMALTPSVQQSATNEVNRVLTNYMAVQADQVNSHFSSDTRSTLYASDVVRSIDSVTVQQVRDNLLITANLSTMAGQQITVQREVS